MRCFAIHLQHDGGKTFPPEAALRRVLKMCGLYGLRCVEVREVDDFNQAGPQRPQENTVTTNNTQLAVRPAEQFMPLLSPAQAIERRDAMITFVKEALRPGVDFGPIPGAGEKPVLLKPGAEKLLTLFGLSPRLTLVEKIEDWTGEKFEGEPFFTYTYRVALFRGDQFIAEAEGCCNSRESKYRYRKGERTCPSCGAAAIIKSKAEFGGGWFCFPKRGGCGAKFPPGDTSIESQVVGRVANLDIADQVNTIMKMGQKRALVGATLVAVNASEFFVGEQNDDDSGDGDAFRVGGDGQPDLSHDGTFLSEWTSELTARGFEPENAREILDTTLGKSKLTLTSASRTWRAGVLRAAGDGKFDHLLPSEDSDKPELSGISENRTPTEISTWEHFLAAATAAAKDRGFDDAQLDRALNLALLAARCKGKPEKTTIGWRRDHLAAIRVGAFDLDTGKINEAALALDADAAGA